MATTTTVDRSGENAYKERTNARSEQSGNYSIRCDKALASSNLFTPVPSLLLLLCTVYCATFKRIRGITVGLCIKPRMPMVPFAGRSIHHLRSLSHTFSISFTLFIGLSVSLSSQFHVQSSFDFPLNMQHIMDSTEWFSSLHAPSYSLTRCCHRMVIAPPVSVPIV